MPGQTCQEGWLLGPVPVFSQDHTVHSQTRNLLSTSQTAPLCWPPCPAASPWLASVHFFALSYFHHQRFHFLSCFSSCLSFVLFQGAALLRPFLWCTEFPLIVCVCLSTCSIMVLERSVVIPCSFHEFIEAKGKQIDPDVSEQLPGLWHCLGFAAPCVLGIEKLPR